MGLGKYAGQYWKELTAAFWLSLAYYVHPICVVPLIAIAVWYHRTFFPLNYLDPAVFMRTYCARGPEPRQVSSYAPPGQETEGKMLVIGAGPVGLGFASAFSRYNINFDIIEATDRVGGNWSHGVYPTVHIISSRKATEFKDFPMPSSYAEFPSFYEMREYYELYTDHFGLRRHIEFNKTVELCEPVGDGASWTVTLSDGTQRSYKGVLVANGHHWDCRYPTHYKGTWDGESLHTKHYKSPDVLVDKRVLVVGGGNSATDVASEAARFGESSHISLRRGYWFIPRMLLGVPGTDLFKPWMPTWLTRIAVQIILRFTIGRYEDYGLPKPDHRPFDKHPTVNSELLNYIKLGRIHPHPDIRAFVGNKTVEFTDGTRQQFDLIVYATGFHISLPMIPRSVVDFKDGIPRLVSKTFSHRYRNLYIPGMVQPRFGLGPLVTAGADIVAQLILLQDKIKHPVGLVMLKMGRGLARKKRGTEFQNDLLSDPMMDLFNFKLGQVWLIPYLPFWERMLLGGSKGSKKSRSVSDASAAKKVD